MYYEAYTLAIIGVFIFLNATQEYKSVALDSVLKNKTIQDCYRKDFHSFTDYTTVKDAHDFMMHQTNKHFMVINLYGQYCGTVTAKAIKAAYKLNRADQWEAWLTEHRQALDIIKTRDNNPEIECLCKDIDIALPHTHSTGFGERFAILASRVQVALQPAGEVAGADHGISNLALLSHSANSALSNAVFEVKRQKVLAMDRAGEYVPVATRNVFLKYYTDQGLLQPHFWGEADKAAYLSEIKKRLEPYLT